MDDYIDDRRKRGKTSLIQRLFSKKPVSEETRPLMNEEVEKELKELAQEEERHFKKEQGFFARLFGKKPAEPTQEEIDALAASNVKVAEEEQPTLPEDVKETIRTLHRWLEKLPAKRLEEFKASEEFQQYKEVLTKYGMVRKKEESAEAGQDE